MTAPQTHTVGLKRSLAWAFTAATLTLAACQDGGLVGTGTRPINSPLSLRHLPSDLSPDLPASTTDTLANLPSTGDDPDARAPTRWTHPQYFRDIQAADASLSELFALVNSIMDTVVNLCENTRAGEPCTVAAGQLSATYTQELINGLIAKRLSSTAVSQLSTDDLSELVATLTAHYDAKRGSVVQFGQTTYSREDDATDVRTIEIASDNFFDGNAVRARWSEDAAWVEVRHRSDTVGVSSDVFFRYELSDHYDVLTHLKTASTDTIDYEASMTLIGTLEETPTVTWSAHELGIRNEYGVVSVSTKGRADMLGAYSRRRLHSITSPDMQRILDYEASYGEMGELLGSRYCTGDLDSPTCSTSEGAMGAIEGNPNYVDFDAADLTFLPDAHTSRWKVAGLPSTVTRFAVFRQLAPNADTDLPLCRGYRLGARQAVLHCTAEEQDLAGADVHLFDILPSTTGQQFLRIPDASLVRAVTSRNTVPAY